MIFRAAVANKIAKTESNFQYAVLRLTFNPTEEAGLVIEHSRSRPCYRCLWYDGHKPQHPPVVDRLNKRARKIIRERDKQELSIGRSKGDIAEYGEMLAF